MKKFAVAILAPAIVASLVFFGCKKEQAATPPPAQPVVTPVTAPTPTPVPVPVPAPKPAPAKPAKK